MNGRRIFIWIPVMLVAGTTVACNLSSGVTSSTSPEGNPAETVLIVTATGTTPLPLPTNLSPVTSATLPVETPVEATTTTGISCTVLQSLNLRSGPGTAYNPPMRPLPADTQLVPTGFEPEGIPGGSWVQVRDPGSGESGWVSAGEQFVRCNLDLTTLPGVEVDPPSPPAPPRTENSAPDGTFPDNLSFEADFNSEYFIRMYTHDINAGSQDGDGIEEVTFTVRDANGDLVYEHSEQTAGFCIFGGGEPDCTPWVFEDFQYKWTPGGQPVEEGTYELRVQVTLEDSVDSEEGNWGYEVKVRLD